MELQFIDKSVTFDTFVTNVAAKLASFMKEDKDDKEYLSQREASASSEKPMYGDGINKGRYSLANVRVKSSIQQLS